MQLASEHGSFNFGGGDGGLGGVVVVAVVVVFLFVSVYFSLASLPL